MHMDFTGGSGLSEEALAACNVTNGRYKYLADLLALDQCRPAASETATGISASVNVTRWKESLAAHPDKRFAEWVVWGFEHGFRVGFANGSHECSPAKRNIRSAKQQAGVISRYLQEERSHERVVDPPPMASNIQVSPFGVIPKPHQPGKWRLILDLSSPHGRSVNDGIDPQLCSLSYARLDDAVLYYESWRWAWRSACKA